MLDAECWLSISILFIGIAIGMIVSATYFWWKFYGAEKTIT